MKDLFLEDQMMIWNHSKLQPSVGRETLVVCGSPRGQTSVVSFALHALGFFLGDRLHPSSYEDQDILKLIPKRTPHGLAANPDLPKLIAARNANHARWGFKLPRALSHLVELQSLLRNPVFVICLRNPASVARSIMQREPGQSDFLSRYFEFGMEPFQVVMTDLPKLTCPVILLDMDRISANPLRFVQDLARIFALNGEIAKIAENIAVPGYKPASLNPAELEDLRRTRENEPVTQPVSKSEWHRLQE